MVGALLAILLTAGELSSPRQGAAMKKRLLFAAVLIYGARLAEAGPPPQSGTLVSSKSVACGQKKKGKTNIDLLCQEYVLRTTSTDYGIRQPKPEDQALFPVNTPIQFTIDKNKVKFKVNGKSYQYVVVSQSASANAATPAAAVAR
jgi:hypothetical protein